MLAQELLTRILAFAAHVALSEAQTPETIAASRNWITPEGDVTEEGRALIAALDDQRETRTVFRGNF